MLKPSIPSKFVERIITSQTGERYRVVFLVTLVDGEVKAKVISAEKIGVRSLEVGAGKSQRASQVFCLPCASAILPTSDSQLLTFAPVVSPFTTLLFFTSQPTRAPSCR